MSPDKPDPNAKLVVRFDDEAESADQTIQHQPPTDTTPPASHATPPPEADIPSPAFPAAAAPPPIAGFPPPAPPNPVVTPGFPQPRPVGRGASSGTSRIGMLAIAAGALVLGGLFVPFLAFGGTASRLIEAEWGALAAGTSGSLLLLGGLWALSSRLGVGLAVGAATAFVGLAFVELRGAEAAIRLSDEAGGDVGIGIGIAMWVLAAVLAFVILLGVTSLGAARGQTWPHALSAIGLLLLTLGVLVPPPGFDLGEHLFVGDGWSDLGMATLLGGLVFAAIAQLSCRCPGAGLLALGVAAPWVASWLAFAIDGTFGGLPVPFRDQPALTVVAIVLVSCSWVGALWWGPASAGIAANTASAGAGGAVYSGASAGGAAFGTAQGMALVLCGATVLVAAAGGASAADSQRGSDLASSIPAVSDLGSGDGTYSDGGSFEDTFVEDTFADGDASTSDSGGSGGGNSGDGGSEVDECLQVECQPSGAGTVGSSAGDGEWDDRYVLGEPCSPAIASDIGTWFPGRDPGELVARYEAGNFVIHICRGVDGETYHGDNITNGEMIVLEASGTPASGFTAYNEAYEYSIDRRALGISVDGRQIQTDPVVAYEEP